MNQFLTDVAKSDPARNVYGVSSLSQYGDQFSAAPRKYGFDATTNSIVVHDAWPADMPHGNSAGCQSSPGNGNYTTSYSWCITDAQVQAELSSVLAARAWPGDMNSTHLVMLPAGIDECAGPFVEVRNVNQCADTDFCAYHSNFTDPLSGAATAPLYAVLPWPDVGGCRTGHAPNGDPAADDGANLVSHEHIETVNDPLGTGWYAQGASGVQDESADKCVNTFANSLGTTTSGGAYNQLLGGNGYYLQDEFANTDGSAPGFPACEAKPNGGADPFGTNGRSTIGPPVTGSARLTYQGGPTLHTVNAYTIFWNGHPGAPPTAAIAGAPPTVRRGDTATFQAASATDPQGQTPSYAWDFGDGTAGAGPTAGHAYQVAGTYTATLTVSDADGYRASDTRTVRVLAPPTASFTSTPLFAVAGLPVAFNSAASGDPDGNITSWSWLFGDGASASGARVNHVYAHAGTYRATLSLADSNGSSASESADVIVAPRAAPALATRGSPRTARAGSHVLLKVERTLSCPTGPTGCTVTLSVTTVQRLVARTARGRRTINRTVGIGTATLTTRPGSQAALALRLNPTGQTLLHRLHQLVLTVHILIRLDGAPTVSRRFSAAVGYPPSSTRRR